MPDVCNITLRLKSTNPRRTILRATAARAPNSGLVRSVLARDNIAVSMGAERIHLVLKHGLHTITKLWNLRLPTSMTVTRICVTRKLDLPIATRR